MRFRATLLRCLVGASLLVWTALARADELPEYRLKAAFLYNFALFTEWPATVDETLKLCVHGADPFGAELDGLQGKRVGARSIAVQRQVGLEALPACQIVFIAPSAAEHLSPLLSALTGQPVLTVADSPAAASRGVMLNMSVVRTRIAFEANLRAARAARLNLSSKLLRLATEVIQ